MDKEQPKFFDKPTEINFNKIIAKEQILENHSNKDIMLNVQELSRDLYFCDHSFDQRTKMNFDTNGDITITHLLNLAECNGEGYTHTTEVRSTYKGTYEIIQNDSDGLKILIKPSFYSNETIYDSDRKYTLDNAPVDWTTVYYDLKWRDAKGFTGSNSLINARDIKIISDEELIADAFKHLQTEPNQQMIDILKKNRGDIEITLKEIYPDLEKSYEELQEIQPQRTHDGLGLYYTRKQIYEYLIRSQFNVVNASLTFATEKASDSFNKFSKVLNEDGVTDTKQILKAFYFGSQTLEERIAYYNRKKLYSTDLENLKNKCGIVSTPELDDDKLLEKICQYKHKYDYDIFLTELVYDLTKDKMRAYSILVDYYKSQGSDMKLIQSFLSMQINMNKSFFVRINKIEMDSLLNTFSNPVKLLLLKYASFYTSFNEVTSFETLINNHYDSNKDLQNNLLAVLKVPNNWRENLENQENYKKFNFGFEFYLAAGKNSDWFDLLGDVKKLFTQEGHDVSEENLIQLFSEGNYSSWRGSYKESTNENFQNMLAHYLNREKYADVNNQLKLENPILFANDHLNKLTISKFKGDKALVIEYLS